MTLVSSDYGLLRDRLLFTISSRSSEVSLEGLKNEYRDVINSTRRLNAINDFAELLSVLEKRGHIGEYSLAGLRSLTRKVNDGQLNELMSRYEENFRDRRPNENRYSLHSNSSLGSTIGGESISSANSMYSRSGSGPRSAYNGNGPSDAEFLRNVDRREENVRKYNEAVELVCCGIGQRWRDLARNLSIKEGEIDEINVQHPNDLKESAREALNLFLKKTDPTRWQNKLLNGLVASRRSDLKEEVEELLSRTVL